MQKLLKIRELYLIISKKCSCLLVFIMLSAGLTPVWATDNTFESAAVQQQITVNGTITDEQGDPLPGVNVSIKGTALGTVSNANGVFSLPVPNENAILVFSYLGFASQEITVGRRNVVNVTLIEATHFIDEVVVVGYGVQKKTSLTGSVVAVQSKELISTKSPNVQNMLTGKLPGLRIVQRTSEPGQFNNYFDVRGMVGDPLIIVDGVPRSDFPRMDANDIENISILKDASATIYGMRGANGVILITTKSGEKGKAKIEYSGYYGIQMPTEMIKPVNAWDRAALMNEVSMRNRTTPSLTYDEQYFRDLQSGVRKTADWYAATLKKTAPQQQHNISVNGGSEKIDYHVNFGYTDQGSFLVTNSSNYNRYNLRTNLNAKITNRLKAGVRLNFIMDERNQSQAGTGGGSGSVIGALWRAPSDEPVYASEELGYYWYCTQGNNPRALIDPDLVGWIKDKKKILQSNLSLDYDIPYIKGLTASFLFSFDITYDDNSNFRKEYKEYRYNALNDTYDAWTKGNPTQLTRRYQTWSNAFGNIQLNYKNTFASVHSVGATVVYEERYMQDYWISAYRQFAIPVPYIFAGNSENQTADGSGLNERSLKSLLGRVNYDYAGKYIGEFAFRYDGNSRFPKGKQWGFFPSVLLAYRISEESFIKENAPYINNLKIRASWGKLGDENASNFEFIEGYNYPVPSGTGAGQGQRQNFPRGYVFGNTFVNGLGFRNAPNMDLTWFTATMKNVGIDADVFNGLLGFSLDFFQRDRDGLMAAPVISIPGTFGSGISNFNLESDRIKGFELELRHNNKVSPNFQYSVTPFVQLTRRMWTKREQVPYGNSYLNWRNNLEGRYNDVWFVTNYTGQYQNWNEIANSIYSGGGTLPGDPYFEDWNGDGVIDDLDQYPNAISAGVDRNLPGGVEGNNMNGAQNRPLMSFGLTLNSQWKWIDFNALFQGSALSSLAYAEYVYVPLGWNGNALEHHMDRWHPVVNNPWELIDPYNPATKWVSGTNPGGTTRPAQNSTGNVQSAAYLRLKSVELGFTVPQNIAFEKLGVQNLRVYVNAYNLFTITGVDTMDPERPTEGYGYLYPLNKTFNFGGIITF